MAFGNLALRATIGGLMVGHGLQKLNGSFGGPGLPATEQMMSSIGMHPAKQQALAAALTETIGGGLTAAGFLNPLGPAMITGTMAVAIKKVHAKNGLWATAGGYEYNLALIAAAFSLAIEGPGALSIDRLLNSERSGIRWGLLSAALGIGAAAATLLLANKYIPLPDQTPVSTQESAEGNS